MQEPPEKVRREIIEDWQFTSNRQELCMGLDADAFLRSSSMIVTLGATWRSPTGMNFRRR
ncbi:hypothetical protein [Streptomyces sp. NPDC046805]|uniref:hypothetical protein n=1 Tax=Streptomyces sp. NPDC046805 TaxID=3155134 RepID=UPI0033E90BD6